jgi:hypothetical protein
MGGMNSGRRYQGGKDVTTDYRALDVSIFQRDGVLVAGRSFTTNWTSNGETVASIQVRTEADRVILDYRHQRGGGEWKSQNYPVRIEWTVCNYGGKRAWFLCPAAGCGKRVAILYCGGIFACRHCYRLAYPSQRENAGDRATRQADKLRNKLGWEPGILNGNGWKPKWMRWRTFEKLCARHDALVGASMTDAARRFGLDIDAL